MLALRITSCAVALALSTLACGARTPLRIGEGGSTSTGAIQPSCPLKLGLPASRVFPETTNNSESVRSSFALALDSDRACFLSLLQPANAGQFTVHQRCMRAWTTLDRGPDVMMGAGMSTSGLVPPANLLVASASFGGFALYYSGDGGAVFGPDVKPGDTSLPTFSLAALPNAILLGAPNDQGHLLAYVDPGTSMISASRLVSGGVSEELPLLCASNAPARLVAARLTDNDLLAIPSGGALPPQCKSFDLDGQKLAIASTNSASPPHNLSASGIIASVAMAPFQGNKAVIAMAIQSGKGALIEVVLVDDTGTEQSRHTIGPYNGGFGLSVSELSGSFLIIQDAVRSTGQMNNAGLSAMLVDPDSGEITSTLDIPLDTSSVDSPWPPVILSSSDNNQALLGFSAQPVGTGLRDYVARIDCWT